jgi:proteasome accessory factor C
VAESGQIQGKDKLTLLLALVPYLMDRDSVSVNEAASHFGVATTQLRDAVQLIAVSGVPGETGAYLANDLFDIDWDALEERDEIVLTRLVAIDDTPRFSAREAAALIAGLQYLSALPENADREVIGSLMGKLARGASTAPSQVAVAGSATDASIALIRDAVANGTSIEFDYLNARGDRERRRVDPLRIESTDQDWYLRGWDHLREAVRTFRLDRMSRLTATDEKISYRPSDVAIPEGFYEGSKDDLLVDVEISESALPLIADYLKSNPRKPVVAGSRKGWVRATMRVAHYHGLKRLATGMSGVLQVAAPLEARAAVADWAAAGIAQYERPESSS